MEKTVDRLLVRLTVPAVTDSLSTVMAVVRDLALRHGFDDLQAGRLEVMAEEACGNVIKTRSTRPTIIVGICNVCHPFYTGQQKFVDTAGRVDKFQQRAAKTQAAQAAFAATKKKKK